MGDQTAAAASSTAYTDWAETATLDFAAFLAVPMNLIDGRPWVPTEAEADPTGPTRSRPGRLRRA